MKTKVLHITDSFGGASWLFNLLLHTRVSLCVIAAENFVQGEFCNKDFEYLENPFTRLKKYERSLNKYSIDIFEKSLLYLVCILWANFNRHIKRRLDAGEINIVHAHFAPVACRYVKLIKKYNIPFIVSFYGYDYESVPYNDKNYYKKYNELFNDADLFLCEGPHGASILAKLGCPVSKIKVVKLGIEINKIQYYKREKRESSLQLIQIASLRQKKGHYFTLNAFKMALETCPNMHLTLIGNGDAQIKLYIEEFIKSNGYENKIAFLNSIDYKTIHDYFKGFDVFIHPSCYAKDMDCEGGAPIVILDAQATGLPVIATSHCDIASEVIDGKTGLLTPEMNIEDLANSIIRFYSMDNNEYIYFSENARKHVEEEYNIEKNSKYLSDIYFNLLIK